MPDDHLLGEIDGAWKQATSELAYERSGPERFLETFYVLTELVACSGQKPDIAPRKASAGWWRRCTRCGACRSRCAACCRRQGAGGGRPIVKDMGTIWEQKLPHKARDLAAFATPTSRQPRQLRGAARVRHHDRAQAHHPGRHHRDPARHRRARPRPALIPRRPDARSLRAALPRLGRGDRRLARSLRAARAHAEGDAAPPLPRPHLYPVSRSHASVQGLQAYPSIDKVPERVDLAVLTYRRASCRRSSSACGRAG